LSDLTSCMSSFLSNGWDFITSVRVPVLGIPFASLFLGFLFADIGLRFLSYVLGFGFGGLGTIGFFTSGDARASASYRGSRNLYYKISDARKHDER